MSQSTHLNALQTLRCCFYVHLKTAKRCGLQINKTSRLRNIAMLQKSISLNGNEGNATC